MKKSIAFFLALFIFLLIPMTSFAEVNTESLKIDSGACILVEASTGKIIYEKNSKEKMYPASTTKILTALIALENCKLQDVATVSQSAIDSISPSYATVYLNKGEELTIEQLLNILLIPSGNIVGNILAEHICGSIDGFVNLMNKRAKELGCVNTNFTNTYGFQEDTHYSCAYDLYLIAKEAMKHDIFRSIVSKTSYKLAPTNAYPNDDRIFYTTNDLIKPNSSKRADNYYYANAIGIKTGHTTKAKDCLVSAAQKNGMEFYSVILGADKNSAGLNLRYTETKKLFEFAFSNYIMRTINEENDIFTNVEIKNATKDTKKLDLLVKNKINVLVDKNGQYTSFIPETIIDENLQAPINKGDVVGHIKYSIDGLFYESDLIAGSNVEKSYLIFILIGLAILAFAVFILYVIHLIKKQKRKPVKYKNYKI